ncbi:MAG: MarR family transcriptional regulator [Nitrolancea sp.]
MNSERNGFHEMTEGQQVVELEIDEYGLVDEVASLILDLAQRVQQHATATAAGLGLTLSQAKVLVELGNEGEGSTTSGALAAKLCIDPSNLTILIDRLEGRGALERRAAPNDRRVKSLVLTPEGLRLRAEFRERLHDYGKAFGRLSEQQFGELRDLLRATLSSS